MAGQKQKKGKAGNAVQYMTRTQALRKLQLSLSQFRKLCIVKGIHPREPNKKTQGQHKTYYHIKDIHFLAHEPLIKKYRDAAVYERKIRKARAKKNSDLAQRLIKRRPTYKLDHLVRERYPTFIDALRDLDDALTLVHLFATLPAKQKFKIPNSAVHTSRRLSLEWQAYIVRTNSLRKTFISVKGFYFQADIMGQSVTWLVPHQISQVLPTDVDYRVMLTFLEFYQTLLQFVNFKLYHTIDVQYPPTVDPRMEQAAAGLAAIMEGLKEPAPALLASKEDIKLSAEAESRLEGLQDRLHELQQRDKEETLPDNIAETADIGEETGEGIIAGPSNDANDADEGDEERRASHTTAGPLVAAEGSTNSVVGGAMAVEDDYEVCAALFKGLVFFMGREVPREQLLVVIRSFGGLVGWEGEESPFQEDSTAITHQICDRPKVTSQREGREYIQPQWVVDSANFRILVDARLYAPGTIPPPHLSPFVDEEEEGYVPDYLTTLRKMQASAKSLRQRAQGLEADTAFLKGQAEPQDEAAREAAELAAAERQYQKQLDKEIGEKRSAEEAGLADSEAEDMADNPKSALPEAAAEEDMEGMKKTMMKRKDRNLYQSILNRQKAKKQKVDKLEQRKAAATAKKGNT